MQAAVEVSVWARQDVLLLNSLTSALQTLPGLAWKGFHPVHTKLAELILRRLADLGC